MVWFRSRQSLKETSEEKVYSRWEQDYNLASMPALGLFDEYLEMGKVIYTTCIWSYITKNTNWSACLFYDRLIIPGN